MLSIKVELTKFSYPQDRLSILSSWLKSNDKPISHFLVATCTGRPGIISCLAADSMSWRRVVGPEGLSNLGTSHGRLCLLTPAQSWRHVVGGTRWNYELRNHLGSYWSEIPSWTILSLRLISSFRIDYWYRTMSSLVRAISRSAKCMLTGQ